MKPAYSHQHHFLRSSLPHPSQSNTPLHWACMRGNLDAVEALIRSGADSAALNKKKQAPVDVIGEILYVRHDIVKMIKQKVSHAVI